MLVCWGFGYPRRELIRPRCPPDCLQVATSAFTGAAVRVAQPCSRNTRRSVVVRAEGSDLAKVTPVQAALGGQSAPGAANAHGTGGCRRLSAACI